MKLMRETHYEVTTTWGQQCRRRLRYGIEPGETVVLVEQTFTIGTPVRLEFNSIRCRGTVQRLNATTVEVAFLYTPKTRQWQGLTRVFDPFFLESDDAKFTYVTCPEDWDDW